MNLSLEHVLVFALLVCALYYFKCSCNNRVEGMALINESTPRWMKLTNRDSDLHDDRFDFLIGKCSNEDSIECRRCPNPPKGCGILFEPHLNGVPNGSGNNIPGETTFHGDPLGDGLYKADMWDAMEYYGVDMNNLSPGDYASLIRYFERQKIVSTCGSPIGVDEYGNQIYDKYKCDYDTDGKLKFIKL